MDDYRCSACRCSRSVWPISVSSRCGRCSRRRSGRWRRPWTSGIRSRASTRSGCGRSRSTSGAQMRVSAAELEALEWGGLLHDVGKIGVPGQRAAEAGQADPRGADHDERAPGAGRADHRAGRSPGARAAGHPASPRVVQRLGLPGPADGRRDPEARADPARRRRVRGDDRRSTVPQGAVEPSRRSPSSASSRASSSIPRSSTRS